MLESIAYIALMDFDDDLYTMKRYVCYWDKSCKSRHLHKHGIVSVLLKTFSHFMVELIKNQIISGIVSIDLLEIPQRKL